MSGGIVKGPKVRSCWGIVILGVGANKKGCPYATRVGRFEANGVFCILEKKDKAC